MTLLKKLRIALTLVMAGLFVQLLTSLLWSPFAFVLFASVGVSLVGAGVLLFLWTVWRHVEVTEEIAEHVPHEE